MKKIYQFMLDSKLFRIVCLLLAGIAGMKLDIFENFSLFFDLKLDSKIADYLAIVAVGIPVFFILWFFRTHDVRQQIDNERQQIDTIQGQIQQDQFNIALENLTSNTQSKIGIAVQSLVRVSQVTSEFNDLIRIAFIERLKSFPFNKEETFNNTRLNYGRDILNWLFSKINVKMVLYGIDLSNQNLLQINFKRSDLSGVSFRNADLRGANLQGVILKDADFTRARLENADLSGADLTGAILTEANLFDAIVDATTKGVRGMWTIENSKKIAVNLDIDGYLYGHISVNNYTDDDWNNRGFYDLIRNALLKKNITHYFNPALEGKMFARALYNRGYVELEEDRTEQSEADFKEANRLDPDNPDFMSYPQLRKYLLNRHR